MRLPTVALILLSLCRTQVNVVLTSRDAGKTGRIPMCGIPYHAKDTYISKLIKAGLKVAICEQLEDPSLAKGIVQRDVIKIITSGTFIDESSYDSRYLVSIIPDKKTTGIAFIDASTGQMHTNQYSDITKIIELISVIVQLLEASVGVIASPFWGEAILFKIASSLRLLAMTRTLPMAELLLISKLSVYECVFPVSEEEKIRGLFKHALLRIKNITLSPYEDWCFNPDISRKSPSAMTFYRRS